MVASECVESSGKSDRERENDLRVYLGLPEDTASKAEKLKDLWLVSEQNKKAYIQAINEGNNLTENLENLQREIIEGINIKNQIREKYSQLYEVNPFSGEINRYVYFRHEYFVHCCGFKFPVRKVF